MTEKKEDTTTLAELRQKQIDEIRKKVCAGNKYAWISDRKPSTQSKTLKRSVGIREYHKDVDYAVFAHDLKIFKIDFNEVKKRLIFRDPSGFWTHDPVSMYGVIDESWIVRHSEEVWPINREKMRLEHQAKQAEFQLF